MQLFAGPKALVRLKSLQGLSDLPPAKSLSFEYSDLALTVEMVDSLPEAIKFINKHGSGHTDAICTEDQDAAQQFLSQVKEKMKLKQKRQERDWKRSRIL